MITPGIYKKNILDLRNSLEKHTSKIPWEENEV